MYGSPKDIIKFTGVHPEDLDQESDQELESLLSGWLLQAKSLIDADRRRSFDSDTPEGIKNISLRMVANMVSLARQRRVSPIIQAGQFNMQLIEDEIITSSIRQDLSMFPAGGDAPRIGLSISNRLSREE